MDEDLAAYLGLFRDENNKAHKEIKEHLKTNGLRISALERWQARIVGGIAVLGVIVPLIVYVGITVA